MATPCRSAEVIGTALSMPKTAGAATPASVAPVRLPHELSLPVLAVPFTVAWSAGLQPVASTDCS